tara:strand:+ start:231 stop:938 length:708 start_codon:yes stop_codon:yes gene_type:complete
MLSLSFATMKKIFYLLSLPLTFIQSASATTILNSYCMAHFGPENGWHPLLVPGFILSVLALCCSLKFHLGEKLGWIASLTFSLWSQIPCLFLGFLLYGLFMEFQLQLLASIMFLYFFRRCAIVMGSKKPLETPLLVLLWLQVWLTKDSLNAYTSGSVEQALGIVPELAVFLWMGLGSLLSVIVSMASFKKSLPSTDMILLYKSLILQQIVLWLGLAGLHVLDRQNPIWMLLTQWS